eukprot:scaffold48345_cov58-Phaeocystis_antarctica.AAC.4
MLPNSRITRCGEVRGKFDCRQYRKSSGGTAGRAPLYISWPGCGQLVLIARKNRTKYGSAPLAFAIA